MRNRARTRWRAWRRARRRSCTFLPLKNLKIIPRSHWLYHDDTIMVPDTLTEGLKTGFLDWDFYEGCFPLSGFTTDTEPVSFASVNFNVGGPLVYNRSFNLATFRHGKGLLIVSTFPLDASSPAGAIILANARLMPEAPAVRP